MGMDSIEPYMPYMESGNKGVFVLVRTSNPGAEDIENIDTKDDSKVYKVVGDKLTKMGESIKGECGYSAIGGVIVGFIFKRYLRRSSIGDIADVVPAKISFVDECIMQIGELKGITNIGLEEDREKQEKFDLVFIDADKKEYCDYLDLVLPLMQEGGWILADNTLWDGHIVDPAYDKDKQTISLRDFNDKVMADEHLEKVILPLRDGLTIIRVKTR